jgi:hypothetical protein
MQPLDNADPAPRETGRGHATHAGDIIIRAVSRLMLVLAGEDAAQGAGDSAARHMFESGAP